MEDASFAGLHGAELEGEARLADALGGCLRCHLQFPNSKQSPILAIEADLLGNRRRNPSHLLDQMLQGGEQLRLVFEQQVLILTFKLNHHVRLLQVALLPIAGLRTDVQGQPR